MPADLVAPGARLGNNVAIGANTRVHADVEIGYDPTIVKVEDVYAGSLLLGGSCDYFFEWLNPGAPDSTIAIDGAMLGCSVDGPGDIIATVPVEIAVASERVRLVRPAP